MSKHLMKLVTTEIEEVGDADFRGLELTESYLSRIWIVDGVPTHVSEIPNAVQSVQIGELVADWEWEIMTMKSHCVCDWKDTQGRLIVECRLHPLHTCDDTCRGDATSNGHCLIGGE